MIQQDLDFVQILSIVSSRFGCTIDDIDFENRSVAISCTSGKDQEIECAMALGDILQSQSDSTRGVWAPLP